jgi:hypothetical protein
VIIGASAKQELHLVMVIPYSINYIISTVSLGCNVVYCICVVILCFRYTLLEEISRNCNNGILCCNVYCRFFQISSVLNDLAPIAIMVFCVVVVCCSVHFNGYLVDVVWPHDVSMAIPLVILLF